MLYYAMRCDKQVRYINNTPNVIHENQKQQLYKVRTTSREHTKRNTLIQKTSLHIPDGNSSQKTQKGTLEIKNLNSSRKFYSLLSTTLQMFHRRFSVVLVALSLPSTTKSVRMKSFSKD